MGTKWTEIRDPKLRQRIADQLAADSAKPVVGVDVGQREPTSPQALGANPDNGDRSQRGVVQVLVSIVSFRSKLLDDDNLHGGTTKNLRDAIAETLGIDDGSKLIKFEYAQVETKGQTGTQVIIQLL